MNTSFSNDLQQLQMELRAQNFDIIRFSTYRTACKLRFIQKKLNFHHLDLLNVIESLRESLLILSSERRTPSSHDPTLYLSTSHLTTFLTSIYTNLNKRLPYSQQILHIDNCVHSAIAWLLYVYQTDTKFIRFNSYRVVIILLCTGKLTDKMRHLFNCSLSSSSSSTLTYQQIDELLHEMLALPYALQEISTSTYKKTYAQTIFSHYSSPISLNHFLNFLIYNSAPNCLQWLIIFDRLISVENVIHRVKCSACQRPSFSGFRYKCQQCRSYQLCQDCFWRGRTSNQHLSTHEMKEYTYFHPINRDLRHSLRKSFQCMPKNDKSTHLSSPLTIDQERKISEHNIANNHSKLDENNQTDEHRQIASYSNQLACVTDRRSRTQSRRENYDQQRAEKKLTIAKLEAENRRILHEINLLRSQIKHQSLEHLVIDHPSIDRRYTQTLPNSYRIRRANSVERNNDKHRLIEEELYSLIKRKKQLEFRIQQLQQSREELTSQLDDLGEVLQRRSSPYGRLSVSPTRVPIRHQSIRSSSTPTTPIHHRLANHLRTDLLLAADSLTSAMSSLVQQLNTEQPSDPYYPFELVDDDFFYSTNGDEKYEDYDILRKLDNLRYLP